MVRFFLVFVLMICTAGTANACALLDSAVPKVGSEVKAPEMVKLKFTDKIYPEKSTLEVVDKAGKTFSIGKLLSKPDDNTYIAVKLKPLLPGTYKVKWNIWCDCLSYTPGDYKFTVLPNGE